MYNNLQCLCHSYSQHTHSNFHHFQNPNPPLPTKHAHLSYTLPSPEPRRPPSVSLRLAPATSAAALLFTLSLARSRVSLALSAPILPTLPHTSAATSLQEDRGYGNSNNMVEKEPEAAAAEAEEEKDAKLIADFENWKSKTYALSVPLRIVALRGSVPPNWVKDFLHSQGKRVGLNVKFLPSLETVFSDLSASFERSKVGPASVVATDLISVGDSWLNYAIEKAAIEPMRGVEDLDWFRGLSDKWKVYLRRNHEGKIDTKGEIWAAPYRWGCMVIAYKKTKFQKHKLAPIEDWSDLWRPELAGRISMVDSPREVVGAVLKHMGASYNTRNIDSEVVGGKAAVQQNLKLLGKQVKLFDSMHYLKSFGVGDVWVAVGWSSDVLPVAKRMSNVAVVVPKSGTSLWSDLWVIPAASRLQSDKIGGRVRGPSPLIHQWIEFCLQSARAVPFKQEIVPGAVPSLLESNHAVKVSKDPTKGKPRLDTNLLAGVPPSDILSRCEFLEPVSNDTLLDYKWLIDCMQNHSLNPKV